MNLFESLQIMKESENKIISEFIEFLKLKNAQYIVDEINETDDGMDLIIYDGDWKHEHAYMRNLIIEFFENKGINISIDMEEIGESEEDTFSARYDVHFNDEFALDTFNAKIFESTNKNINYQVTCQLATSNDDVYSEHSTLKDAIKSARKAQQSFMNVKIKDLKDGSSWSDIDDAEQDLKDGLYERNYNLFKNIQLKESVIPTKGEADGYQGLISITPSDNCKGIPQSLMKYICKIYPSEKIKDIDNFEIKNNKLYANVPINTLKIQYKLDVIHTTDKIKHDENRALIKKQYDELISTLKKAGWKVDE